MRTLKLTLLILSVFSLVFFSCSKDDDVTTNNTSSTGIIPSGYENKLFFTNVYNSDTTDFVYGVSYVNDTLIDIDLYFIDKSTQDTLNMLLASFPYNNNAIVAGTYNVDANGMLNTIIAGDYSHGEFFADSGQVIIQKEASEYIIAMDLYGTGYGASGTTDAELEAYFKGVLTEQ